MRYKKAQEVFPEEIMKIIQQYVDGEYIYIPRKENQRKAWGETTQSKLEIAERNKSIYRDYEVGYSKQDLADQYFLSVKSIERIVLNERKKLKCYEAY